GTEGKRVIAQLADVDAAGERRGVQRLDVGQAHVEIEALEIDAPVHNRIEHEAVVGTGRKRQRQLHTCCRISAAARHSATMAPATFHAWRFRRSTMFETARTCANGTRCIRHADMNAAPSMLSTCGANLATAAAIDAASPCTVLTVMPRTGG